MASESGALPQESCLMAFSSSGMVGMLSRASFVSTSEKRAIASSLMDDGRLRTELKCSARLFRIFSRSVIKLDPSAIRSGYVPDDRSVYRFQSIIKSF